MPWFNKTLQNTWMIERSVAQITPGNGWQRYFQYDARGHCTLQTDASGDIVEQYDYDAFGFPYFYDRSGNNIGSSPWGNRFLFTGREWLKDLRIYDYRNRLYQPELGRFLQPDPKQFDAGDYNLYRYCHNDPVNKMDPFGYSDTDTQRALFESGMTLLGMGVGSFFGGGAGSVGILGGPAVLATVPVGAVAGAAIGGGIGMGIGKALSPVLFSQPTEGTYQFPDKSAGDNHMLANLQMWKGA